MTRTLNLDAIPALVAAAQAVGVPLDGHTLGMIGEAHAARLLGLTLVRASTEGYDALEADGRTTVEIKATTRRTVGLRSGRMPDRIAILRLDPETLAATVVYYGPAAEVWAIAGPLQKNGTRSVSLSAVGQLASNPRSVP